jgi:RND family efflux transporter MFP subunit
MKPTLSSTIHHNRNLTAADHRITRLLSVSTMAVVIAAILAACGKTEAQNAGGPPPPQVTVAQVLAKEINEWDELSGRVEATDFVEIRPRVNGYLTSVNFQAGSMVKKGDLLFAIDARPFKAEAARADADLRRAETARELAKSEVQRAEKLVAVKAISQQEFDQRVAAVREAESQAKSAQAALNAANLNVEYAAIRAPISGRVSRAEITVGNLVSAGQTMLTTVASQDPVHVYFDVDEQQYLKYVSLARTGERPSSRDKRNAISMGLANEDGFPHQGYVDFVDNRLDTRTGTMRGRAVFDNKQGRFTPGLFAKLKLVGSGTYNAMLINERAVGTDQSKKFVLVVDKENKATYRPVKLGPMVDGLRVVREGLQAGETIIVNGLQRVRPGMVVNPQKTAMLPEKAEKLAANPFRSAQ